MFVKSIVVHIPFLNKVALKIIVYVLTSLKVPSIRQKFRKHKPRGYWRDITHKRKFFVDIAAEKGFDPYVVENWVKVTNAELLEKKVSDKVIPNAGSDIVFRVAVYCGPLMDPCTGHCRRRFLN